VILLFRKTKIIKKGRIILTQLMINRSGKNIPVYSNDGMTSWGSQVGTVMANELFSYYGTYSEGNGVVSIGFYSPSGWRQGYIKSSQATSSFLTAAYAKKYGEDFGVGYAFKVLHRQSRIFSGGNVITAVQPGGWVISDGSSSGIDNAHPYRLSIKGYMHSGGKTYYPVTNGSCDTDIEIGKSMYNTVTIDAPWV
jgi:hypothetical protein